MRGVRWRRGVAKARRLRENAPSTSHLNGPHSRPRRAHMKSASLIILSLLVTAASVSPAEPARPLLLREPTVSRTHVVFTYAGDLWIVPREGGDASRLTNGVGNETAPLFSPDGKTVAFTGEYDGNVDIYL